MGINFFVENGEKATTKWGKIIAASFVLLLFQHFCFPFFSFFFFSLSEFAHVRGSEGQAGTFVLSDARLGRFPSSVLSLFLAFLLSLSLSLWLSLLSDSSDKLSLSSAHMALGENQCPYVSSAALHCTDEG